MLGGGDLSKHLQTVGVHDGNAAEGGALLEGLKEERSGGLKLDLGGLELGKLGGVVDLGAAGLLAHLPDDGSHLARNLGGTGKDNRAVAGLENTGVLLDNNHGTELGDGLAGAFGLLVDDVSGGDLLILGDALDGHTNGVTGASGVEDLLVLLDGEHLLAGEARGGDADDVVGLESSLLDGSSNDLSNTLDVVDIGDGKTEGFVGETGGGDNVVLEGIEKGEAGDFLLGTTVGGPSLVPGGLVGLLDKVVAVEARVGDEGDLLGLVADHLEHLNEFVLDLIETALVPVAGVHLVDSDKELLNTEEVKETGVLAGLALLNTELGVGLGNGGLETTLLGGDKKKTDISGGGSGDHVLDVILVAGGINDGVVVLGGEELLGVALDGNTTLALLLAGVKVVGESERGLALFGGGLLELGHLTLGDSSALEDKVTACGRLAGIDVPANNNGEMLFSCNARTNMQVRTREEFQVRNQKKAKLILRKKSTRVA